MGRHAGRAGRLPTRIGRLLPRRHRPGRSPAAHGTAYVTGAEAQAETGEPQAEPMASATTVQGFTFCFFVRVPPGERHVIDKADRLRSAAQPSPLHLDLRKPDGSPYPFRFFMQSATGNPPFWTYCRGAGRLLDPSGVSPTSRSSTGESNDYPWATILDVDEAAATRAGRGQGALPLGFLLLADRTPARRRGRALATLSCCCACDLAGTEDGSAWRPHPRASRRIGRKRIVEQGDRRRRAEHRRSCAAHFADSVGIGWYNIDVHHCVGSSRSIYADAALSDPAALPPPTANLVAAQEHRHDASSPTAPTASTPSSGPSARLPGAGRLRLDEGCLAARCGGARHSRGDTRLRRLQRRLLARRPAGVGGGRGDRA